MTQRHYFVNIRMKEIQETSAQEEMEYEIVATPEETEEIQELFLILDKDSKEALKFLAKPFDEWGADNERGKYGDHLMTIYSLIHKLGTTETKKQIDELNLPRLSDMSLDCAMPVPAKTVCAS